MSRKHNTKHDGRGQSHYPDRLRRRGVTNVDVRMEPLDVLRRRAGRKVAAESMAVADRDPVWDEFYDELEAVQ